MSYNPTLGFTEHPGAHLTSSRVRNLTQVLLSRAVSTQHPDQLLGTGPTSAISAFFTKSSPKVVNGRPALYVSRSRIFAFKRILAELRTLSLMVEFQSFV